MDYSKDIKQNRILLKLALCSVVSSSINWYHKDETLIEAELKHAAVYYCNLQDYATSEDEIKKVIDKPFSTSLKTRLMKLVLLPRLLVEVQNERIFRNFLVFD